MIQKGISDLFMSKIKEMLRREHRIQKQLSAGRSDAEIIEKGVFYTQKETVKPPLKTFLDMWDTVMFQHHKTVLAEGGLAACFPELSEIAHSFQ
jgi:hypothetical protein